MLLFMSLQQVRHHNFGFCKKNSDKKNNLLQGAPPDQNIDIRCHQVFENNLNKNMKEMEVNSYQITHRTTLVPL